jgi:hypothetical protein
MGDGWIHEIKHDGYRIQLVIERGKAQAFTRNRFDWSDRYRGRWQVALPLGRDRQRGDARDLGGFRRDREKIVPGAGEPVAGPNFQTPPPILSTGVQVSARLRPTKRVCLPLVTWRRIALAPLVRAAATCFSNS